MIAEEALMHANVRAALDPDPARAYRYKPFAYGPFGAAVVPGPALVARVAAAANAIAVAARRAVPAARPAAATQLVPCC